MADNIQGLPSANDLASIEYIRNLLGLQRGNTGAGQINPAPYMSAGLNPEQLNAIMTEWLRGPGQFLEANRQQNISGLYNSSSQKLVQNDLMAQAALKAATAQENITRGNQQIAAQIAMKNADIEIANQKGKGKKGSDQRADLALAMMLGSKAGQGMIGQIGNYASKGFDWIGSQFAGDITQGGAYTDAPTIGAGAFDSPSVDMSFADIPSFDYTIPDDFGASMAGDFDLSGMEMTDTDWTDLLGEGGYESASDFTW